MRLVCDVGIWSWYVMLVHDTHIWELDVLVYDICIWCWYVILTYENYPCWYMMLVYDVRKPTFSLRYMRFTCDVHIWLSNTNITPLYMMFTCDLFDFHMWCWHVKFGIWCWYVMLVCDVGIWCWHMMFTCEHIQCWYMNFVYDHHIRFSSLIICRSVYDHIRTFLKIFIFQKYRIWYSHVKIFVYDVHMWTLFPMRCKEICF